MGKRKIKLSVLIEQDEDGVYIATVPELKSCYTYANTLEELLPRIREVIELCIEELGLPKDFDLNKRFVGVQQFELEV
jgi:predicted RNase H-like HicB family nuclease